MKKMLVPCDFSQPSVCAFQFALDVAAGSRDTVIHLLHVIELPVIHDSVLMPVLSFEENLLKELKDKAEKQFDVIEKKYNTESVTVIYKVQFGKVPNAILKHAADHNIEVIIMGSHGATGIREFFLGSNAEKLVRDAEIPVLVLKDQYKGPVTNIVFPNTLETEGQEELIRHVKKLQSFFKAKLHIVWINTPVNFTSDSITQKRFEKFVKRYQLSNYSINVFNHMNAEEGILEFTRSIDASLIAIGTHGRKGISRFMHGSLTGSIVNHTGRLVWSYLIREKSAEDR